MHATETGRQGRYAVEVAPDPDRVHAGDIPYVLDVVGDITDPAGRLRMVSAIQVEPRIRSHRALGLP